METLVLNRTAASALTAAGALAGAWLKDGEEALLRSADIADATGLPQPLVAKLLVQLAGRRLVAGSRGRNGGYRLARPPDQITLFEIVRPLQRWSDADMCPFERRYCERGSHCAMHEGLSDVRRRAEALLRETTLEAFSAGRSRRRAKRAAP